MAPIDSSDTSLFHLERISQYVTLPPLALNAPLPATCASVFSPLLLSYYPPARGIVLAYQNAQLSDAPPMDFTAAASSKSKRRRGSQSQSRPEAHWESENSEDEADDEEEGKELLLRVVDEYSAPFVWATAELLVWRPQKNVWIQGRVTHQSSTHITLSHLNTFPISILKADMPEGWEWNGSTGEKRSGSGGDEGFWVEGDGMPVEEQLRVRIRDWDGRMDGKGMGKGFLRIVGSLVSEETEKEREIRSKEKRKGKKSSQKRRGNEEQNREAMEVE